MRHNNNDPSSDIDLQTMVKLYTNNFRAPTATSDVITASRKFVSDKQQQRSTYRIKLSTSVVKYICALKLNCSPAGDSIESEHLRQGISSDISTHISIMLSLCLRFSVVPGSFANGLLIPIPGRLRYFTRKKLATNYFVYNLF